MTSAPPKIQPQQLEFQSIAFPADRSVLTAIEVAAVWRVTHAHIIDLLEEGKLDGFDIAGRHEYLRVPMSAIPKLATLFKVPEAVILKIIAEAKSERVKPSRAHWRIPKEAYTTFIAENHALAK